MPPLLHIFLLLVVAYAVALAAWPVFFRSTAVASPLGPDSLMLGAITLGAFLARDQSAPVRGIIAASGLIAMLRVHSYACSPQASGFGPYAHFLSFGLATPHLIFSPERIPSQPRRSVFTQFARIAFALALIPLTWRLATILIQSPWCAHSWWANQFVLATAFIVVMTAFGRCATAAWQLQGSAEKPLVDAIFLARSPADFWRRWSWPMHLWLYRYVYIPAGGRLRHVRATLLVFLVSGLLHEFMAALVIGRVTGHQTIFFMLSAVGVLLSPALEELDCRGVLGRIAARLLTLLFLIGTSSFMFATLHYIFPVYRLHTWLLW